MFNNKFEKTIYNWQVPCMATAVSAINSAFGISVLFTLADAEYSKDPALNEAETTGVAIMYKDLDALWNLGTQFGKHSLAYATTGRTDIGYIH